MSLSLILAGVVVAFAGATWASPTPTLHNTANCSSATVFRNDTLFFLDPKDPGLQMVNASSAWDCCSQCSDRHCFTWSFSHHWAHTMPCHLSWEPPLSSEPQAGCAGGSFGTSQLSGQAWIDTSAAGQRQVFEGVWVELMSDSIGSDNSGMPEAEIGIPHDLVPSERVRLATEVQYMYSHPLGHFN